MAFKVFWVRKGMEDLPDVAEKENRILIGWFEGSLGLAAEGANVIFRLIVDIAHVLKTADRADVDLASRGFLLWLVFLQDFGQDHAMMAFLLGEDFHFISSLGKTCGPDFFSHGHDLRFAVDFSLLHRAQEAPEILGILAIQHRIETCVDCFLIGRFNEVVNYIIVALFLGQPGLGVVHHGAICLSRHDGLDHLLKFGSLGKSIYAHNEFLQINE